MCIPLRKAAGKFMALLWPLPALLFFISCDLVQPYYEPGLGSKQKNELLSQAKEIFQCTVDSLSSNGMTLKSAPSYLFDPGDIIPQWKQSDLYKKASRPGDEYWFVCTPVDVDFFYQYSSSGDIESIPVSCDVELQIILGNISSCCLVYAMPDEDWYLQNIGKEETVLDAVRNGKSKDGYNGLLIYTDINGMVYEVLRFDNGESHMVELDDDIFSKYCFSVYRSLHTKAPEGDDTPIDGGTLKTIYVIASRDGSFPTFVQDYIDDDGGYDGGGFGGGSLYGGGGDGSGSSSGTENNNPANSKHGVSISYDKQKCFVGYDIATDCLKCAKETIAKMGKSVPTVRTTIATRSAEGLGIIDAIAAKSAVSMIIATLNNSQPVIVGVTHSDFKEQSNNTNKATQHWIVISGYEPSGNGYYFTFIETGRYAASWAAATSDNNRLYYNPDTGTISGSNYNSKWKDYIVTETKTE